ncbi:hypothetical protein SVAN01_07227 [Stagonosporopsis vannaccii]|nr:hypothetical protein SVAN01_07227 [Stagonosporopsis vannaccii]
MSVDVQPKDPSFFTSVDEAANYNKSSSLRAPDEHGHVGHPAAFRQKAAAASIQSPFLSPIAHICVDHIVSSLLLRPCIEPLLLSQETMRPTIDRSSSYKTRTPRPRSSMILLAASLIHTTSVSPDMRGRSIFDNCSLLHFLHNDHVSGNVNHGNEAGIEARALDARTTRAKIREQWTDITIGEAADRSAAARIARDMLCPPDAAAMVGEEMLRSARPGLMKTAELALLRLRDGGSDSDRG